MGSSVSNPASCNRQKDKWAGSAERVLSALWRHICHFETLPETYTLPIGSTWGDGKLINWEGKSGIAQVGMGTRERKQQVDFIKKLSEPGPPVQSARPSLRLIQEPQLDQTKSMAEPAPEAPDIWEIKE